MLFAEEEGQRREMMPAQILGNCLRRAWKTEILRFTSVPRVSGMFVMPRTEKDKGVLLAACSRVPSRLCACAGRTLPKADARGQCRPSFPSRSGAEVSRLQSVFITERI